MLHLVKNYSIRVLRFTRRLFKRRIEKLEKRNEELEKENQRLRDNENEKLTDYFANL